MRPILTTSCLLAALLTMSPDALAWEKLPPLPEPNGGFVGGVHEGRLIIAGGTHWEGGQKNWLRSVHAFDPQTRLWQTLGPLPQPVAYAVGGVTAGGAFVFAGGFTGAAGFPELLRFGPRGQTAARAGLPAAPATVLAAGGVLDDRLIFTGGTDDPASLAGITRRTFALDLQGRVETLPDFPGRAQMTAASAVAGGELFVFTGATTDAAAKAVINTDEAHAFSLQQRRWRSLRPFPYAVRGLTAVALTDGLIYLAGGFKSDAEGFTDAAFVYDTARDSYRPAPPLPYKAMVGLLVCDGFLYCLGGEDKQKSRTDACHRLALAELLK